jgi:hypothetical protein
MRVTVCAVTQGRPDFLGSNTLRSITCQFSATNGAAV